MFRRAHGYLLTSAIAVFTLAQNNPAYAADEVTVTAEIVPSCVITATTLAFGGLSAAGGSANTSIGLTQCGSELSVDVSLNGGDNESNGTRQLDEVGAGADKIAYTLTTGGASITTTSKHNVTLTSGAGSLPVDGAIDGGEVTGKEGGDYLDKIDVTVDFAA